MNIGVSRSVLNLKNGWASYWQGCKKAVIAISAIAIIVTTLLLPMTPSALAQTPAAIQAANVEKLQVLSDRFDRLEKYIYAQKWVDVRTYIHGPFGEIRRELRMIAGKLDKTKKETSNILADDLFKNFIKLDVAAKDKDAIAAEAAFKNALKDFEGIVELVKA